MKKVLEKETRMKDSLSVGSSSCLIGESEGTAVRPNRVTPSLAREPFPRGKWESRGPDKWDDPQASRKVFGEESK